MQRIKELFSLESDTLLTVAITHESVISRKESMTKYGTCQNVLAAKGDARLKNIIVDYVHEQGLPFAMQIQYEKNHSLYLWAERMEILDEFFLDPDNFGKRETYIHAVGTCMEAILELVYREYGMETLDLFVRHNYFQFVDAPETKQPGSTAPLTPKPASGSVVEKPVLNLAPTYEVNPDVECDFLESVRREIKDRYGRKITLTRRTQEDGELCKLSFHVGEGVEAKPLTFEAREHSLEIAVKRASQKALRYLSRRPQLRVAVA